MKILIILSIIFELYHGPGNYHIELMHIDTTMTVKPIGKELFVKLCEVKYK